VSFLVPDAGAIVRVRPGRAEVQTSTWSATFEGELADDVASVSRGAVTPRLAALGAANAPAAAIASWSTLPWLPLTTLDAVRLDGFDTLFLELLGTCNERCVHCYAESSPQVRAALARETCETIVDDAIALGFRRIQFTGGDPLICQFLPDLVARARPLEYREIYTNGLMLDDELLDRLAPHAPSFAFSYYSHDPAVHDAITRTPGSHRRTRTAIARAVARGLDVRAGIIVLSENVRDVDAAYADLESIGVALINVGATRNVGRGSAFAWKPRAELADQGAGHRSGPRSEGKLAVTYDGNVVPCIFNRGRVLGTVGEGRRLRDVIEELATGPGDAAGPESLSCGSCQVTDRALALLGGSG
jgi:MoaA/NifB/PqqE/SkfB family radical SAM enzyme